METETQTLGTLQDIELTDNEFLLLSKLIHKKCGINIQPHKKALVKGRLLKRLRALGFASFKQYYKHISDNENMEEIVAMIDAVSTNVTHFFRENHHFEFLSQAIVPEWKALLKENSTEKLRVWSSACSSGEEVYSLAITIFEEFPDIAHKDFMILGSDISTKVLHKAETGLYSNEKLASVPHRIQLKYFEKAGEDKSKVKDQVRRFTIFKRLNLMAEQFPFKNPIDVIFCRNVLIYFDKPTQQALITKFHRYLKPGGYLFLGHSEGLTGVKHEFQYVRPSIYRKV